MSLAPGIIALLLILWPTYLAAESEPVTDPLAEAAVLNQKLVELYEQGRYAEATEQAEKLLKIMESVLGPDDPNVATLLGNLATLYSIQGQYEQAEPLYRRSLTIRETALGSDHPDVANSLNNLAAHYRDTGQYDEAEAMYERALAIREAAFGADHPDVAQSLNNLGALYDNQGRYAEAEPLYRRALTIREAVLGPDDPRVANTLNNLAALYESLGRYADAEALYERSLNIRQTTLGPDHPDVAQSLNNIAFLYDSQGRYGEAEQFYKRALAINEKALGADHPHVAGGLNNLAALYVFLGRYDAAEPLYDRALAIRRRALGPDHPDTAQSLNNLALLYDSQGRFAAAETMYKDSLAAWEKVVGLDHPDIAVLINNLAALYSFQGRFEEAESYYSRSLDIREKAYGLDHPDVATALHNLAGFYEDQARYAEAESLYERALAIMESALGPGHARVANSLNNLAALYQSTDRQDAAEPLLERALSVRESVLGPDHTDVAESLNNLALLYDGRRQYDAAEPLYNRAITIVARALGPEHPYLATILNNLASLLDNRDQHDEAERLYKRALEIRRNALGGEHRDVAVSLNNLAAMHSEQGRYEEALHGIREAVAILAKRANRSSGQRSADGVAESKANRFAFLRHVRLAELIIGEIPERRASLTAEAFEFGQRARASRTAQAVANMAARFAAGGDALAEEVRERQRLADRLGALESALVNAASRPSSTRDQQAESDLRRELSDTDGQLSTLDRRLAKNFPKYAEIANPKPVPLTETQALLGPDEAILSWLAANNELFLFGLRSDRAELFRLEISRRELDAAVTDLRATLDPSGIRIRRLTDIPPFETTAAFDLYQRIFAPAAKLLADARHVFVVPDGALQSLPLGVLVTEKPTAPVEDISGYRDVPWLARRYALTVLPSISSLRALREFAANARALIPFRGIGNPSFKGKSGGTRGVDGASLYRGNTANIDAIRRLSPLPDTEDELKAMAESLGGGELLLASEASEANVRNADFSNVRVIAFATHGLVAGDIGGVYEPALALTPPDVATDEDDGLLTASEIARHLTLDADWVVLSACNTAAGDRPGAEGLSGLAKAFFYAGSRALLVSHWPVASDAATRLTTRAFAIAADDPRLGRSEAFRRSMLDLMASPQATHYAHPMFWAPFVVVGEGGAPTAD